MPITFELCKFLITLNNFNEYSFVIVQDSVFVLLELNKKHFKSPKNIIELGFEFVEDTTSFRKSYDVDLMALSYDPITNSFVTCVIEEKLTKSQKKELEEWSDLETTHFPFFISQQKNQQQRLHDLMMLLLMSIETKQTLFDNPIWISKINRQVQNSKLEKLRSNTISQSKKEEAKSIYYKSKIFETDLTIDLYAKLFREMELLARLIISLNLTSIPSICSNIEQNISFSDIYDFYMNNPVSIIKKRIYNKNIANKLNMSNKERKIVHQVYDIELNLIDNCFTILPDLFKLTYNIRNNYFHTSLWFPNIPMETYSNVEKGNLLHLEGYSYQFILPKQKKLSNNKFQFYNLASGILFTHELTFFIHAINVIQRIIVNYFLVCLQRDQKLLEVSISSHSEKLITKYKEIVQRHYSPLEIGIEVDSRNKQLNLDDFKFQKGIHEKIKKFNRNFNPIFQKNKKVDKKKQLKVKQSLHIADTNETYDENNRL